jgi:uncharacterized protein YgiM (DUF1202 family)
MGQVATVFQGLAKSLVANGVFHYKPCGISSNSIGCTTFFAQAIAMCQSISKKRQSIFSMRYAVLLGSWLLVHGVVSFAGAQTENRNLTFPYTAYALRDDVSVRSGPGDEHYATSKLTKGTLVEVFRHDPGDWCAVRPVDGSFSMIPADMIEVLSETKGRCKSADVQVWVGTELGPVEKPLWQVKLKQGEEVALLGEISYPTTEGFSTLWYQIEPPPGEFRWMRRADLMTPDTKTTVVGTTNDRAKPFALGAKSATSSLLDPPFEDSPDVRQTQATDILDDPFADDREVVESGSADNLGWRRAKVPLRMANNDSLTSVRLNGDRQPTADLLTNNSSTTTSSFSGSTHGSQLSDMDVSTATLAPTVGNELMSERLQRLDIELASEIIKPAESWNLNSFSDRLLQVQETAASPAEQVHARRLIEKVDRLRATQSNLVKYNVGNRRLPATSGKVGTGVDDSVQFGTTYDAYGWLSQLTRNSGRDETAYALQDDNGKIICVLEPSPGLNLHRYLNAKIGVTGTRGFNQQLKINHVIADRIVVLDKGQTKLR